MPTAFDDIARRYEKDSLVQRAASELLFELVQINPREEVLDLGCGTGHLSRRIGEITAGRVLGVDPSREMVAEATAKHGDSRVRFAVGSAETLSVEGEFDVVFCNSAFQWFRDGARAVSACHRALRPGGRMAIQAPATAGYCPNFLAALEKVAADPVTGPALSRFRSPWLFLESAEEYVTLFRTAGFRVPFSLIQAARTQNTPEEVMRIFESGAAAGYLDPVNYGVPLPTGYPDAVRSMLRASFQAQAGADGKVDLVFNRIYLVAVRA